MTNLLFHCCVLYVSFLQGGKMTSTTNRSGDNPARRLSATGDSLYIILGIEKSAAPEDIKRSYRKLALKYHPDKNPNNPEAVEKFKDINRAHSILSDETKRKLYDSYGSMGLYLAEQLGEENVGAYYLITSGWCKGILLTCGILTCCYFCCCCFCCCFNFCCGRCKPKQPDENFTFNPDDIKEEETAELRDNAQWGNGTEAGTAPVTSQPGQAADPWGERSSKPIIAMPPPPTSSVNEGTNLTGTRHSSYQ